MRQVAALAFALLALLFSAPAFAQAVDLNAASAKELEKLPGIGKGKAAAIIEYREKNGGFKNVDELKQIKGIGKATLEKLRPVVSVNGVVAPADPAAGKKAPAPPAEKLDLNTATLKELDRLPGIGKSRAKAIVAYREQNGGFKSVDELAKVDGIGKGSAKTLADYVTVGSTAAAQ